MSNLEKKIKIGDTEITLGELLKNEDLQGHLNNVKGLTRAEEKEKLQASISTLKMELHKLKGESKEKQDSEEITTLKTQIKLLQNEQQKNEKSKGNGEKTKKSDGEQKDELKNKKENLTIEQVKQLLAEQAEGTKAEREAENTKLKEEIRLLKSGQTKQTFNQHKAEILKKYKGYILPSLLDNIDSSEKLDAYLPTALDHSKKYITKKVDGKELTLAEIEKEDAEQKNEPQKEKVVYVRQENGFTPPKYKKETELDVKNMSSKEFAEHRDTLIAQLRANKTT